MAIEQFRLPDPGEGLTEAEIVEWKVAVGDVVKINDIVVEIETAKSLVELPIPYAGTVAALLVQVGDTVEVGTPIISIDTGGDPGPAASAPPARAAAPVAPPAPEVGEDAPAEGTIGATTSTGRTAVLVGYGVKQTEAKRRPRHAVSAAVPEDRVAPHASARPGALVAAHATEIPVATDAPALAPAAKAAGGPRALAKPPVRKFAKDHGIDLADVAGSGPGGAVTRADVEAHVAGSGAAGPPSGAAAAGPTPNRAARGETRIPVRGVRKMTAQAMVGSAFTAPHVTEWITVDVTATVELLDRLRGDREFAGVRLTPLVVLAKAMCLAWRRHPDINAAWDEAAQEIVVKGYVNLGIAAATPRGLIVPNVKDADLLTLRELAEAIAGLTATARDGRTQPADMAGGTMTITNVGVFGVDTGTPILNPGESAIVVFGAIRKQPWVVTAPDGSDEIAVRHVTTLGMSFDHRLVDGELGSRYLADLAAILHDPARGLVWG
ncbi:MAG: dihydrolipoamide acetyltransferase family protein [Dermatophilaceae bacterium]